MAALTLALAACVFWIKVSAQSPGQQVSVPIVYTSTPRYESGAWLQGGERFPAGATVQCGEANRHAHSVSRFAATADPSVSFDGTRILFSGKRDPKSHWQVWEASVEGRELRQVTVLQCRLCSSLLPARRSDRLCAQDQQPVRARNRAVGRWTSPATHLRPRKCIGNGRPARWPHPLRGRVSSRQRIVIRDLHRLLRRQRRRVLPLRSRQQSAGRQAGRVGRHRFLHRTRSGSIQLFRRTSVGAECTGW